MGLQSIVESLIDCEQNVLFGCSRILLVRLGLQAGARHQIGGVAKVGDELAHRRSRRRPRVDNGIVQRSCRDAAVIKCIDCGQIGIGLRPKIRSHLARHLLRSQRS